MSNDWRELDVKNLPSDILVDGAWEIEFNLAGAGWEPRKITPITSLLTDMVGSRAALWRTRIRRPEGWEPKECPRFGLTTAAVAADAMRKVATLVRLNEKPKECPRCGSNSKSIREGVPPGLNGIYLEKCTASWHDEPKKCPTCGAIAKRYTKTTKPNVGGGVTVFYCKDSWHDEPKAPTHEEIMTKWWKFQDRWMRVSEYGHTPSHPYGWIYMDSTGKPFTHLLAAKDFIDRQSADIPLPG